MSETSFRVSSPLPLRVTSGIAAFLPGRLHSVLLPVCLMLLVMGGTIASARPRRPPFKFAIKAVDSATGKPRSKFFLGERVAIVYTLTNQSNVARVVTHPADKTIPVKLTSSFEEEELETREGSFGGTSGSYVVGDMLYWTHSEPRKLTLAPGQTVSVTIADLGRVFSRRFQEGNFTLTATYNSSLKAAISFQIVIDEAKSVPLLEQLAEAPIVSGDESDRIWANSYLRQIRQPSITGRITDADGKPLKEVWIDISGAEKTNIKTRGNGRYCLTQLTKKGGTYTLTPSLGGDGGPGNVNYKIEPSSRTIANVNAHVTGVNFRVTRVRAEVNVASEDEGAKARASSILGESDYSVESVIDDIRNANGWGQGNDGWNDGTPNAFPDWLEVNLGGTKTIDWINVFTLRDNYSRHPADPEINETFSQYGITDFDVQYWNGKVWQNVPGGAIRGNRNVWRRIAFPTIATSKIRVVVRNALAGHSRIVEIEAFHINDLPKVKILTKASGQIGSPLKFRTEAFDRDGTIDYYKLDFGDGPQYEWNRGNNTAGKNPELAHQHTYTRPGTYTVRLRAVDNSDDASETLTIVTITDPPESPQPGRRPSSKANVAGEALHSQSYP